MTKPHQYQRHGVEQIKKWNGRAILGDEMGLGKSFQSLLYAYEEGLKVVIVVCPAGLKTHWEREVQVHLGQRADVIYGRKVSPDGPIKARQRIVIINYELLKFWLDYLIRLQPELVIVDECQNLTGKDTQRTRCLKRLSTKCPRLIFMSGTPLVNRPKELWPVLNMLDPKRWSSFFKFGHRYCKPERKPWGWTFDGASNLDELNQKLRKHHLIRRLKKDVLKDLPSKQRMIVPLSISKDARKEYEEARSNFLSWLAKNNKSRVAKAAKAAQLVKAGYLRRLIGELKLEAAMEWLDTFLVSSSSKIIVFAHHKSIIRRLHENYRRKSIVLDGSVKGKHRQLVVDQFSRDPKIRILFGSKAAIVGWNGTAADTVAFFEFFWAPAHHTQAEDRPHRIGQSNNVTCYYLGVERTVDERICNKLQEKHSVLDAVLDGKPSTDYNIFDLFIDELRKEAKGVPV